MDDIKNITSDSLINLGFTKIYVIPEEYGDGKGYSYYIFEVNEGCVLISDTSDDNGGYFTIEFSHNNGLCTSNYVDLCDLIRVLNKMK